jgi:hypothetical protein
VAQRHVCHGGPLRTGALDHAVLTSCAIDPADADPIDLSHGIAVLNIL